LSVFSQKKPRYRGGEVATSMAQQDATIRRVICDFPSISRLDHIRELSVTPTQTGMVSQL